MRGHGIVPAAPGGRPPGAPDPVARRPRHRQFGDRRPGTFGGGQLGRGRVTAPEPEPRGRTVGDRAGGRPCRGIGGLRGADRGPAGACRGRPAGHDPPADRPRTQRDRRHAARVAAPARRDPREVRDPRVVGHDPVPGRHIVGRHERPRRRRDEDAGRPGDRVLARERHEDVHRGPHPGPRPGGRPVPRRDGRHVPPGNEAGSPDHGPPAARPHERPA